MPDKSNAKSAKFTRKDARELDVKITFMEGIVRRDPKCVEALQISLKAALRTERATFSGNAGIRSDTEHGRVSDTFSKRHVFAFSQSLKR